MKLLFLFLAYLLPVIALMAQQEDHFPGYYENKEVDLRLEVKAADGGYEGTVTFQGKPYPFQGMRLLGILQGIYQYQGNDIPFSLTRVDAQYFLTSEGVVLEMVKGKMPAAAPAATAAKTASAPAGAAKEGPVPKATGARMTDPYGGYSFQVPQGWQGKEEQGSFLLTRSGDEVKLAVGQHNYANAQELLAQVRVVEDPDNNTYLTPTTEKYGSSGMIIRLQGQVEGNPVTIETLNLFSPHGGGTSIMAVGPAKAVSGAHAQLLKAIAQTVQFSAPKVSPVAQQWKNRIGGRQLLYLKTHGGGSERTTINLFGNGQFTYHSNTSYTSGGYADFSYAGRDRNQGTWKIVSRGNQPVLLLFFNDGSSHEYKLNNGENQSEILANGRRYFLQPIE